MDIIFIKGLTLNTIVGIFEHERKNKQRLILDIDMATDIRIAAESKDIHKTVNYKSVSEAVAAYVDDGAFLLVETMAEGVAQLIMSEFSVSAVKIRICKPDALPNVDGVGVYIERGFWK
mgnify:CR=1 FL=1